MYNPIAMLVVHHLNNSRSQRVLWLLEELGVPYEIVKYERDPKTSLAPESLRKIHPLGKSPIVTDDGLVLAESGAILEYLVEKYGGGRLVPKRDTPDFQRYRFFMHYAEGSLMPFLLLRLMIPVTPPSPWSASLKPPGYSLSVSTGSFAATNSLLSFIANVSARPPRCNFPVGPFGISSTISN